MATSTRERTEEKKTIEFHSLNIIYDCILTLH